MPAAAKAHESVLCLRSHAESAVSPANIIAKMSADADIGVFWAKLSSSNFPAPVRLFIRDSKSHDDISRHITLPTPRL